MLPLPQSYRNNKSLKAKQKRVMAEEWLQAAPSIAPLCQLKCEIHGQARRCGVANDAG
jgi:hypothetical protein